MTLHDEINHYRSIVAALRDEGLEPTWLAEAHTEPLMVADSEWTDIAPPRSDILAEWLFSHGYPTP